MIADLKAYPTMRDSGAVWLGEVPEDWNVLRGRQLFEIKKRISGQIGHPVISVTQAGLRVKDVESGEGQLSQDYSKYQTVEVGEFAMNSMDLLTGGVGIATSPGVTSPDYRVFAIRAESRCCDRYMLQVLRMLYWNRGFYAWGQGSAQLGRWRLPRKRFNDFPFPVPPHTEQVAIARFLDWANGRLERATRAKRKVIALLNKQKQAIIHRAVTRGLDPSAALKPSGIPWLGDIPKHWRVSRIKNECQCLNTRRVPLNSVERGAMASRLYDYYGASGVIDKVDDFLFDDDLLLIAEDGANLVLRNLPLAIVARGKFWVNNHAHILKPRRGSIVYLAHLLETLDYAPWISGAAQPKLTQDRLLSISIAVAPPEEQETIIRDISEKTHPLVGTISRLEREIDLLQEYRTRLVADVVTGKLDVREAAARLPDEALPDATDDDIDLSDEAENADAEATA